MAELDRPGFSSADEVVVVAPRADWAGEFAVLSAQLAAALGGRALRIDHIGSTAVPGLAAKDVLDVQVAVADAAALDEVVALLHAAGYEVRPPRSDHRFPGAPDDPGQHAKRLCRERPGDRRANVHVRVAGNANWRYALLFRDFLWTHRGEAEAYSAFKLRAAVLAGALDDYTELKDPVCDLVYLAAERWANATGWSAEATARPG